jgi:hypothetical protein
VSGFELGFALVLALVLLGLAVYVGRRQLRQLRGIAAPGTLGADDRRYTRTQAYRRLWCSVHMGVLAGFLIGGVVLELNLREVQEKLHMAQAADPNAPPPEEHKDFVRFFFMYWAVALLVLLVLLTLATLDFWATARFGLSQHRRLQDDQRALLQEQVARRRRERNGQQ